MKSYCLAIQLIALALLGACTLNDGLKTHCVVSKDCNSGNSCEAGVCIAAAGPHPDLAVPVGVDFAVGIDFAVGVDLAHAGGACAETVPPSICSMTSGPLHPANVSQVQTLLIGRWLFCYGDSTNGDVNFKIDPQDHVGLQFNSDGTWWFLVQNASGEIVQRIGTMAGGTYTVISNGDGGVELMMSYTEGGGPYPPLVAFTDSPLTMQANFEGHYSYYVFSPPPAGCGG
jgi:hypothetical protein